MKQFGRYHILQEVGEGTFGIVYRARDERLGREVALKVLRQGCFEDSSLRKRFEMEARLLSRLNHPNIETLYDFESDDDQDYLVMEFIEGQTLQQKIASARLTAQEILHIGAQLCDALKTAHARGVVHRDLKPGNLMIKPDGTLKVLDFGLAKLLRPTSLLDPSEQSTQSGAVVGTLPYLTPEQIRGESAEERSDIHCVGAILYEMATGIRAFPGDGTALLASILNDVPTQPRSINPMVPDRLEPIIMKCLEKSPEFRYQSAAELGQRLSGLYAAEARRAYRKRRNRRRNLRIYLPTGVVAAALIVVLALMTALPTANGVAVLPFDNLGPDGHDYYAEAVSDQLFSKLVRVSDLTVTPRTSARAVDTNQSLQQIAQLLGVDAIVDGTVLRANGQIRVSISVARVEKSRWRFRQAQAKTIYEEERTFEESELLKELGTFATEIVDNLVIELYPEEKRRLSHYQHVNAQAFDQYARGRHEWNRRTPQAFGNAIQFFEASIRADSTFAPAYAGLTDCYSLLGSLGYDIMPPTQAMPQAIQFARKALDCDETLAEAHTALAHILHNFEWDWSGARREFERAMELAPGDAMPYQWYSYYYATMGQMNEAVALLNKSLAMEPSSVTGLAALARMYYYKRDYSRALESIEQALARDQNFLPATILMGAIYIELGRLEEAREIFEAGMVVTRGAAVFQAGLGAVFAAAGDREQANLVLRELEARDGYVPAYYSAAIHVKLGNRERALDFLEQAVEERSEAVLYMLVDPWVDDLRSDPRFTALLERVGLPTPPSPIRQASR